jgi:RNA polymerase sigma-54 factor
MRLDTSMIPRMEQKMILAPRMIQSMEILQLPIMALQERIQQELQENPVLEQKESGAEDQDGAEEEQDLAAEPEPADVTDPQKELVIDDKGDNEIDFDRLEAISRDWEDHFNEEHRPSRNGLDEEGDKKHDAMQNMASRPQSLQDYLRDQLPFLEIAPEQMELIKYLISHIDENGYLTTSLEEIARGYDQFVTEAQLEEVLRVVQKLDPPGVGGRNLRECLLLQLTPETPQREVLRVLIQNHLEDIQHNRLPNIQKRTGFDMHTIHEAIEALKHLNPRPGAVFTADNIPYVVPDIAVDRTEEGDYQVTLLDDWVPSIYISRRCMEMYRDKGADPKTREYLKRKIQAAQWLME